MRYLSKEDYEARLKKIKRNNRSNERKLKLREEKLKYKQKSKIETSKLIAVYLFVIFNVILVYTLVAMWVFADLSYLSVLITDVVAQILLYGIYCLKAYSAKKQEEQLKFEKEKLLGLTDMDVCGNDSNDTEVVG